MRGIAVLIAGDDETAKHAAVGMGWESGAFERAANGIAAGPGFGGSGNRIDLPGGWLKSTSLTGIRRQPSRVKPGAVAADAGRASIIRRS